jgi:hypothetical protein
MPWAPRNGERVTKAERAPADKLSDTHHALDHGDGFREALNPSCDLLPDELFDVPDEQINDSACHSPVQSCLQTYFRFSEMQISLYDLPSRPERGAFRDRHKRGAGCGGRKRCD